MHLHTILDLVNEYWEVKNFGRMGTLFKVFYDLMGCDAVLFVSISKNTASPNRRISISYRLLNLKFLAI